MAILKVISLNDEESNKFLVSKGFVNIATCTDESVWVNSFGSIYLHVDDLVREEGRLFEKIFQTGYRFGQIAAKEAMIRMIGDKAKNFINSISHKYA